MSAGEALTAPVQDPEPRPAHRGLERVLAVGGALVMLAMGLFGTLVAFVIASLSVCSGGLCTGTPYAGSGGNPTLVRLMLLAGGVCMAVAVAAAAALLRVRGRVVVALSTVVLILVPVGMAALVGADWRGCPTIGKNLVAPCGNAQLALLAPTSPVTLEPGQTVRQGIEILSSGPFTLTVTSTSGQVTSQLTNPQAGPNGLVTRTQSGDTTVFSAPNPQAAVWELTLTSQSTSPATVTIALRLLGPGRAQ